MSVMVKSGTASQFPPSASVILDGCADDLVVSDPGCEYPGCGVRGYRVVHAFAAALAPCAPFPRRALNRQNPGQHDRFVSRRRSRGLYGKVADSNSAPTVSCTG